MSELNRQPRSILLCPLNPCMLHWNRCDHPTYPAATLALGYPSLGINGIVRRARSAKGISGLTNSSTKQKSLADKWLAGGLGAPHSAPVCCTFGTCAAHLGTRHGVSVIGQNDCYLLRRAQSPGRVSHMILHHLHGAARFSKLVDASFVVLDQFCGTGPTTRRPDIHGYSGPQG